MNFDSSYFGPQDFTEADAEYAGSRYSEVRDALFFNRYYDTRWGAPGNPPLPSYGVTLGRVLKGILPFGEGWRFQQAARRAVESDADMRWGPDGKGFRRLLHPNGVCLLGRWMIDQADEETGYSGYFKKDSEGLIIGRYSTCCSETRRGHTRSLSLVGKIYPTTKPDHSEPLRTANFIAQEDLGGKDTEYINDADIRNAPDVTPWRRGAGLPTFLLTVLAFMRSDEHPEERQLYPIAELDKPEGEPTRCPEFMRLLVDSGQRKIEMAKDLDFRDEILANFEEDEDQEKGLVFHIEVSDTGKREGLIRKRVLIENKDWKRIGTIVFEEAVASYNGDFVLHYPHPPWRKDRNDPNSVVRKRLRR